MKKSFSVFFLFLFFISLSAQRKEIRLKILQTSDIHGSYFPYDFIEDKPAKGSLSRVASYLNKEKLEYGQHLIMLDNGDILQGQPSAYYYNFVDTVSPHLCARILNYMGYVAGSVGNHDIETGNKVYDRLVSESSFPWMAANALRDDGNGSYFKPYKIIEIEGIRIAVLGMITPAIPTWLPKNLWPEMHFEETGDAVQKWMQVLKNEEKADVILGLFHLGMDSRIVATGTDEGGGMNIAMEIPGLDVVMLGHDHRPANLKVANADGDSVLIINPGANGNLVSDIELRLYVEDGKVLKKEVTGKLVDMEEYVPDSAFMKEFQPDFDAVKSFVSEKIGYFTETMGSRTAYFGSSPFVDLIHRIQLSLTGADVSFAAPLSYDTEIEQGDIFVSDMFKLYKYENFLYTMTLSGKEIKGFLESCYGIWMNQMKSKDDHLLLISQNEKNGTYRFVNPSYNFDAAAGISYTVDVSKPVGERITISPKMKNGKIFSPDQQYRVAINSYRGNGGGGHLTEGAGIPYEQLSSRIVHSTDVDLRYYMMEWIRKEKTITPEVISDWKLIPESWARPAAEKDYQLLFGKD